MDEIGIRNARRTLEERAGAAACSVCGGTEWASANEGEPIAFLSFAPQDDPLVRVLALACRYCGYLRLHSLDILELSED